MGICLQHHTTPSVPGLSERGHFLDPRLDRGYNSPMRFLKQPVQEGRIWLLVGLLLFIYGCATQPLGSSSVALTVDQLRQAFSSIKTSYEKKDEKGFFSMVHPSFQTAAPLKAGVLRDFNLFSEANISLFMNRVQIEETSILTWARWEGVWKTASGSSPLERRGYVLFEWTKTDAPQLLAIQGDSPFGIAFPGE